MNQPNVLLILCDQLTASVLSLYGGPVSTPNIDELARGGAVFGGAYCQTPFCTPSRASLIMGRYPHSHGLVYNVMRRDYPTTAHLAPPREEGIEEDDVTLEKVLHGRGYACHHYGKWHLSGADLSYHPDMYREHYEYPADVEAAFREARGRPEPDFMNWYGWELPVGVDAAVRRGFGRLDDKWKSSGLRDFYAKIGRLEMRLEDTFDWRVADKAISAIRGADGAPFCITCSFNWPHDPNVVPSPYYEMYEPAAVPFDEHAPCEERFAGGLSRQIAVQAGPDFVREFLRVYYGCVRFVDDQVGRVMGALAASGRAEDTIVVFTADHGDMAGEHGMFWKSTSAFYDAVARVPLVIKAPGLAPGRYDFPVELNDVLPTLLELAGAPALDGTHGESLVPYCAGKKSPAGRVAVSERITPNKEHARRILPDQRGSFMLYDGTRKYIRYGTGDGTRTYLYDHSSDPGETRNLAGRADMRGVVAEMEARLRERLDATGCARSLWEDA